MKISHDFESDVLDVIKTRRSLRAFSNKPVESDKIKSFFEAARWAPSSSNEQPWSYIYAIAGQPLWQKIFETLNKSNQVWAKDAPLLVVSLSRRHFLKNGMPNDSAKYDLGAANAFLSLQATQLGLNVHQMGGLNSNLLRTNLNIPDAIEVGVVMAIGYKGNIDQLPNHLKERELSPRVRISQNEFAMNHSFE